MANGRRDRAPERREPAFEDPAERRKSLDLRLTRDDRPGWTGGPDPAGRPKGRRDPTFEPSVNPAHDSIAAGRRVRADASRDTGRAPPPAGEDAAPPRTSSMARQDSGRSSGKGGGRDGKAPRRRRGSLLGGLIYWGLVLGVWAVIGLGCLFAYHASKLPPIDSLAVPKRPPNIAILASDGTLLANRGETGGRTVTLRELPPYLPSAFVAIEDHRFYSHLGIDPVGITRAVVRNLTRSSAPMQGGSTLTQQLAKNLFLTQERTASRKIQEAILAMWLERNYSKDQILELYLNRVYFGSGAYGVEAAAQKYFSKSARAVTLSEAAILAGLVQAPSRLAPNRNPDAAQARGQLVIAAMAREGFVTEAMAKIALMNPPEAARQGGAGSANYAADFVMDVLDDFIGTIDKDIVVRTTLDSGLQAAAERALVDELALKGEKFGVSQGAMVAMQPDGAVRALVGGRNYSESQFNRATTARRQPGSAFKPFVFLTAIERGLTPDSVRDDAPVNIRGWQPENSTRDYRGPVTLRAALANSINTVSVRLTVEVGPKAVVKTAQRLGIQSTLAPNASIALGTSEVAPIELVAAYASFANGGIGVLPYVITQVKTSEGESIYRRTGGGLGRVIEPGPLAMMNAMLRETLLTGTARKAELPGWDAAGKTGTSQDHRDAWFVGYTGSLVAGVWLGNDDGTPTKRTSGSNLPVEIWSRFMKQALAGTPAVALPGGGWRAAPPGAEVPVASLQGGDPGNPSPPPPPTPTRATGAGPLVITPVGTGSAPAAPTPLPPQRRVASDPGVPRPPGSVGPGPSRAAPPPPSERTMLERLFGG